MIGRLVDNLKANFRRPLPREPRGWVYDTVSPEEAAWMSRSRRYNAADLIARCEGVIDYCVRMNAQQCTSVPIRLYTTNRRRGKRISGRAMKSLVDHAVVGPRAKAFAENAAEVREIEDHPVLSLINRPSEYYSGSMYQMLGWMHRLLCGTSYEYVEGDGVPVALLPLFPTWVDVQASDERLIAGYWYRRNMNGETFYDVEEVDAYWVCPDLSNPYVGRSPLAAITQNADLASAIVTEALARVTNGSRPDFAWVSKDPNVTITPEQIQQFEQRMWKFRGPKNAGRAVVSGSLEPKPLSWSYKDMEWKELADRTDRIIRNAFGVPESMAMLNDANLASGKVGLRQYLEITIQPLCVAYAEQLTDKLLPRFGIEPGEYYFAFDKASPEDEERASRVFVPYVVNGVLTRNEVRAELGFDPIGGGDTPGLPYAASGIVAPTDGEEPTGEDAEVVEPVEGVDGVPTDGAVQDTALNGAQVTALADITERVVAGRLPPDAAAAMIAASFPTLTPEQIGSIIDPLRNFTPTPEATPDAGNAEARDSETGTDDAEPMEPEDSPAEGEKARVKASGFWFTDDHGLGCQCEQHKAMEIDEPLARLLRDWYARWGPALAREGLGAHSLTNEARQSLQELLRPELERMYRDGLLEVIGSAGQPAPQTLSEAAVRGIDAYTSRLSGEVTDTLLKDIRGAIERGIADGLSTQETTRLVADTMGTQADWRAERVARTETGRAMEYGRLQGLDEVGVKRKRWLISSAPCQFCQAAVSMLAASAPEGTPIDQPFFPAGSVITGTAGGTMVVTQDVMVPSDLHPNDSCAVAGVWNT